MTYTESDAIETIRKVSDMHGPNFTREELDNSGLSPGRGPIYRLFGSLDNAKECAGLEFHSGPGPKLTGIDVDYFRFIDSPEKAYWLGFIFADGCVSGRNLRIAIHPRDEEHLRLFAEHVGSEYKISHSDHGNPLVGTTISNRKFVNHLKNCGIVERKTYSSVFPTVPAQYSPAFVRGYFDGDGHISVHQAGGFSWNLYSISKARLEKVGEMLSEFGVINWRVYKYDYNHSYRLVVTSPEELSIIYEVMYDNNPRTVPSLYRKASKIQEVLTYH